MTQPQEMLKALAARDEAAAACDEVDSALKVYDAAQDKANAALKVYDDARDKADAAWDAYDAACHKAREK